jgi:hypothetical protein
MWRPFRANLIVNRHSADDRWNGDLYPTLSAVLREGNKELDAPGARDTAWAIGEAMGAVAASIGSARASAPGSRVSIATMADASTSITRLG